MAAAVKKSSAAALGWACAVQRFAEKHAELAKRTADVEASTQPILQDKPELPTNEACRRNPMQTADEYRGKAAECERLARDGDAADLHALYLIQAAHWRFLAEQADQFERQAQKRGIEVAS
jgi:hypothetical protein